jgi:hypothetical protein
MEKRSDEDLNEGEKADSIYLFVGWWKSGLAVIAHGFPGLLSLLMERSPL